MEGPSRGRGGEGRRQSEEVIFLGILTFSSSLLGLSVLGHRFLRSFGYHDTCLFGY